MSKEVPYFAIGNNEIATLPDAGDSITCYRCGKSHTIEFGTDKDGYVFPTLGFVKCGGKSYIATINGKAL